MCKHQKWIPGKMVDAVGSDEQIWQEGFWQSTLVDLGIVHQRCTICEEQFDRQGGITANDIKRKEDGTRMVQTYRS